jgi:hypothetical protein
LSILTTTLHICNALMNIQIQILHVRIAVKYTGIDRITGWIEDMYRMTRCKHVSM